MQAGDLVDTLKSDGPFTVFAPTDEAFAKLPAETVEELLKPEIKDQLVAVLVRVNDATVIAADVEASNGVIHVIDTVLLP